MRLVEEFPQGVDVDILILTDHEDAGRARPSIPAACNETHPVSARSGPARPRPGTGTHLCGRRGSRTPTPRRGPRRSTAVWRRGPPPAPPVRGWRPVRGARGPPAPSPPLLCPARSGSHYQRWLHVHLLHGGGRAPARRCAGRPRRGCPRRCLRRHRVSSVPPSPPLRRPLALPRRAAGPS